VIPHQSNERMLKKLEEKLKLGKNKHGKDKIMSNIENVGNTVASSTPLCLFDYWQQGIIKNGDKILMLSFGAGYTLGIVELVAKFEN
jgi:3-oxoacyl-[acyl-carrier-protein] synthase III